MMATKSIMKEPTKVEWKKVDQSMKGVSVPEEKPALMVEAEEDSEESGVDSEFEHCEVRTVRELIVEREGVRNRMLGKGKGK